VAKNFITLVDNSKLTISRLETDPYGTNAYLLRCVNTGQCALIDAPGNPDIILKEAGDDRILYILMTHAHMDHIMALEELKKLPGVTLAAHREEAKGMPVQPDRLLEDGVRLPLGKIEIKVIHTPGHTPGGLCYLVDDFLLGGDTLFPGGPGKTDSPESLGNLLATIETKIMTLPDQITVFPGHGLPATIGEIRPKFTAFLARGYDKSLCGDITW
jgi:glyoxylase-like metal-dependent hydrolase (beta-lactamase superfamily II)